MAKGRKPKPESVKAATGNPGRRPLGKRAAAQAVIASGASLNFPPPADLTADQARVWIERHVMIDGQANFRASDLPIYRDYVLMEAKRQELQKKLDDAGYVYKVTSKHGERWATNPLVAVIQRMEGRIRELVTVLGFGVEGRTKIGARANSQLTLPFGGAAASPKQENQAPGVNPAATEEPKSPDDHFGTRH